MVRNNSINNTTLPLIRVTGMNAAHTIAYNFKSNVSLKSPPPPQNACTIEPDPIIVSNEPKTNLGIVQSSPFIQQQRKSALVEAKKIGLVNPICNGQQGAQIQTTNGLTSKFTKHIDKSNAEASSLNHCQCKQLCCECVNKQSNLPVKHANGVDYRIRNYSSQHQSNGTCDESQQLYNVNRNVRFELNDNHLNVNGNCCQSDSCNGGESKSNGEKEDVKIRVKECDREEDLSQNEIGKTMGSDNRLENIRDDELCIDVKKLKEIYQANDIKAKRENEKFVQQQKNQLRKHQQFNAGATSRNAIWISREISVKNLCRSFVDLTNLSKDKSIENDTSSLKRAKSVGDMLDRDHYRIILTGVSVKALRDSYCSLVGVGSSENSSKKSSFSKFDALQKKNILHVRSTDAGRAQEKFNDAQPESEKNCRACGKIVYKMEEMKAERNIYHKNCFRCNECSKPLNVDNYQSHESVLYCKPHFRLLFAPKAVEDNEPAKTRKPELIIRENEPAELPPDVVRASDKPDLGLDELHQLNVKERFQVFEHYKEQQTDDDRTRDRSPSGVKRSTSILSKLAKFQAKGMNTGINNELLSGVEYAESSESEPEDDDDIDDENEDADLIRAKRAQRERPMSFSNMNDIKSKFENGHLMTREERREERKQEIQNIRSRLFMGKQARIKEMYQQAVADSEQAITSTGKKPEIDIGDKARTLKEKFEKGEIFKEGKSEENKLHDEEMEVFEQGISKQSRSLFQNLDASVRQQVPLPNQGPRTPDAKKQQQQPFLGNGDVVKSSDKNDDIKIETSEISSKFRFFEQYRPEAKERKPFRITPPRDGVVKTNSPEPDKPIDPNVIRSDERIDDPTIAKQSHTATKMLSIFRQMEESQNRHDDLDGQLKPLKRFTPPPDGNQRTYNDNSDDDDDGEEEDEEEDDEEEEEEEEEIDDGIKKYDDEFLREAQSLARAKQLRAKFEKWEANEIQREMNNSSSVNLYEHYDDSEEGQVESAKTLRAKFEALRETTNTQTVRPRVQVNRFV